MDGRTWVCCSLGSFPDGKLRYPRGSLGHDSHLSLKGLKLRSLELELNPARMLCWDSEPSAPLKPLPVGQEHSSAHQVNGVVVTSPVVKIAQLHSLRS